MTFWSEQLLQGQVAIISGGLGDIGKAIARELAGQGASIALGDLLPMEDAAAFVDELGGQGVAVDYQIVDVSDAEAVGSWVHSIEDRLGTPSLLIPNAAIVTMAGVQSVTTAGWKRELGVNLDGAFYLAQNASSRLVQERKKGRIVFIGSWAAHAPHPYIVTYSVSKAALRMLSRCMALDLAPYDILVNEVAPGYVDAGLTAQIFKDQPDMRLAAEARVPLKRLITAREVALQVAHLCHPENLHMTGSTVLMDGGLSLLTP